MRIRRFSWSLLYLWDARHYGEVSYSLVLSFLTCSVGFSDPIQSDKLWFSWNGSSVSDSWLILCAWCRAEPQTLPSILWGLEGLTSNFTLTSILLRYFKMTLKGLRTQNVNDLYISVVRIQKIFLFFSYAFFILPTFLKQMCIIFIRKKSSRSYFKIIDTKEKNLGPSKCLEKFGLKGRARLK